MRVIAGSARRLVLVTPTGENTRPTQDRIKETLFNMLQNEVPGSVFIDLCAGSGGIGIEALSRGAARAYFVENAAEPYKCIQTNLHTTHFEGEATIIRQDVTLALRNIHEKEADIVYIDPPYEAGLYDRTLAQLKEMPYITEDTLLIAEAPLEMEFDFTEQFGFKVVREKNYKTNKHVFIKRV